MHSHVRYGQHTIGGLHPPEHSGQDEVQRVTEMKDYYMELVY